MLKRYIERRVAAEIEERAGYTDIILAGLQSVAEGRDGSILETSALEIAARMWAGALAGATVEGTDALTPSVRAMVGRQIIRAGEIVLIVRVREGRVRLEPIRHFEVMENWRYRCEIPEPPGKTRTEVLPRESVLHLMFARDPGTPWAGVSPMAAASMGASLAANIESRLRDAAKTPAAVLIPIPTDGGESSLDQLREDIAGAKGSAVLVESTAAGWQEGQQGRTQSDWGPKRLGPEIPDGPRQLHEDALQRVMAACGIPGSLASVGSDGTQIREDYRRFVLLAVEPWAKEFAAEAGEKLDAEVSFSFEGLWAHDLQGRSSAVQKLQAAGVPLGEALRIAGLSR